jgi:hypothetical protein
MKLGKSKRHLESMHMFSEIIIVASEALLTSFKIFCGITKCF